MNVHSRMTLKELANAGDAARIVLDRAGLDYCCEGHKSLAEACARAEIALPVIEGQLRDLPLPPAPLQDWRHRGITELLDHILSAMHPRSKQALDELAAAAEGLASDDRARAVRDATDALLAHVARQMREEEEVIFARVRALADARKGRGPFPPTFLTMHEHGERLRDGHARTHAYLRRMHSLVAPLIGPRGDHIRSCIDAATAALTEQMHLENNELLPRAQDLEPSGGSARA